MDSVSTISEGNWLDWIFIQGTKVKRAVRTVYMQHVLREYHILFYFFRCKRVATEMLFHTFSDLRLIKNQILTLSAQ